MFTKKRLEIFMHDTSIFKICIDFEKSHDSYIYDKNRQECFLDFFGLYATLPLGYNHPIFQSKEFRDEYNRIAAVKVPNCEIISYEAQEFLKEFSEHKAMKEFKYFYFCCTGALAIEAALKTAIDQKGSAKPVVISLRESFHGINGFGGFATDRFFPVSIRLDGFPEMEWQKIQNPKITYNNNGAINEQETKKKMEQFLREFDECINKYGAENIAALLIEPIQSTYGDNYFPMEFFKKIRILCNQHKICLVFDEIQTGFGVTGTMWYFQQIGIVPDIVAFGKKLQVSGVMVNERFNKIFERPVRLEVTWDGNLVDMIRGKYILRAYERYDTLDNVRKRSTELLKGLRGIEQLKNVRGCGLLICFDFDTSKECDSFFNVMMKKRFMCNKTRDMSIRLRPNLNVSSDEVNEALQKIASAFK